MTCSAKVRFRVVTMKVGRGVKAEKAQKALEKAGDLVDGESVWFYAKCNQFKPMIDAVVVTNVRLMGLSTMDGFKYKALVSQVKATHCDQKKGTVEVTTSDGQVMIFKRIHSDDVPTVGHFLEEARKHPAPKHLIDALIESGAAGSSVLAAEGASREDYAGAKKAHEQESKRQRTQERASERARKREVEDQRARDCAAEQAGLAAEAGELVESTLFGGKTVEIYKNGFIRVVGLFSNAPYERLLSIEASADVGKKSAVGRSAAAVMTGGISLLGSNKRGDVYLTIVTDRETHVLHQDPPTARGMQASKKLEAAGRAVLQCVAVSEATAGGGSDQPSPAGSTGATVAERLRELNKMRDEGLVSAEEYEQLRTKLLGAL